MEIHLKLGAIPKTSVCKVIATTGQYEPEVFALLLSLLDEKETGAAFLNIGSNIGLFPLAATKLGLLNRKYIKVFAHEPLPMLQVITRRLMDSNEAQYELRHEALGESVGVAEFYVSAKSDSSSSLVKGFRTAKEVIPVQVDTLDSLYLAHLKGFAEVVLVIDVETAEPAVLGGGRRFLEEIRPLIICEVLANRTETSLSKLFLSHRYAAYRFDGDTWIYEEIIRGDTDYRHRDWFFVPEERIAEFGERYKPVASHQVNFSFS